MTASGNPDKPITLDEIMAKAAAGELPMEDIEKFLAAQEEASAPTIPLPTQVDPSRPPVSIEPGKVLKFLKEYNTEAKQGVHSPHITPTVLGTELKLDSHVAEQLLSKLQELGVIDKDNADQINEEGLSKGEQEINSSPGGPWQTWSFTTPAPASIAITSTVVTPAVPVTPVPAAVTSPAPVPPAAAPIPTPATPVTVPLTPSPAAAPASPKYPLYGYSYGQLLDFVKNQKEVTAQLLMANFNIGQIDAEETIADLKHVHILDATSAPNEKEINEIEATYRANNTLNALYDIPQRSPTPITPTPTVTAPPAASATGALTGNPAAGPLPPDASAGEQPIDPETLNRIGNMVDSVKSWLKGPRGYVAAALATVVIGFAASGLLNKGDPAKNGGQQKSTADNIKKAPAQSAPQAAQPTKTPGAATATVEQKSETQKTNAELPSNYENSIWWKELDPEVQKNIQMILTAPDAQTYTARFLQTAKSLSGEPVSLSEKTSKEVFDKINRNPKLFNQIYFGVNESGPTSAPWTILARPAANEPSGPEITIDIKEPISMAAKTFHMIGERELGWRRDKNMTEGQTLSATFDINKAEIIKMINENTK
jgi:hypothetical protein